MNEARPIEAEPKPPASLVAMQEFFTHAFRRATPVVADEAASRTSARFVAGNDRLTPAEQVDIYRRQFWLRHEEALREDFPTLVHVLGDTWDAFVADYLEAYPPATPNLRDLGASALAFVKQWPKVPPALRPLAEAAARYELAFIDVFDGADPPALDPGRLAALTHEQWERATLVLSPLVVRMHLELPVHELRRRVKELHASDDDADFDLEAWRRDNARPVHLALFRHELVVHFEELPPDAYALLEALGSGATLLEACASIAEGKDEAAAQDLSRDVGGWFSRWASWGFITDIVVAP